MSRDYGEIFCDAVNQLIQNSLSTLNYDITRNCTITNIDDRKYGKYQVSDGTIKFYAYASNDTFYELNDSVLVTIPEGDFNKQATIINRIADPFLGSINYNAPFDTLLKGTENICLSPVSASLTANNINKPFESVIEIKDREFFGFTKIGLQADFSTLLEDQNVVEGSYGLKVMLYTEKDSKSSIMDFTFSSYDMFGNPYKFSSDSKQQIVFDIPQNLNHVKKIEIIFYQDSGFKNENGKRIQVLNSMGQPVSEDPAEWPDNLAPNLFVKNLEMYFGYAADIGVEERVEISSQELSYTDESEKLVYLKWFHKTDENTLRAMKYSDLEEGEYSVKWYQYKPGCLENESDSYGGANWKIMDVAGLIQPDDYHFIISFNPSLMKTQEKIKAIVFVNDRPLVNNTDYVVTTNYESNILTFENADIKTAGGATYVEDVTNDLSLYFEDGSEGNYFLYDQNGFLINNTDNGPGQIRKVSLRYQGQDIQETNVIKKVRSITWEVPNGDLLQSMISYNNSSGEFKNPHQNLVENVNELNLADNLTKWKTLSGADLSPTAGSSNGLWGVNDKAAIISSQILNGKDVGIYTIISNNTVGIYNFKSVVKVFSANDDIDQIQVDKQAKVFLQIFTSNDGSVWDRYSYNKTFMINPLEQSTINASFRILQEHKYLKVAIGYSKDQDYDILPDDPKFFVWLGEEETELRLNSDAYVNTYYPSEDGVIQSYFEYEISSIWTQDRNNNFIQCSIDIDGQVYLINEILQFGPKGSNGTHNTFLLEMLDGKNALIVNDEQKKLRVRAILLNANGKEIKIDKVKWQLLNNDEKLMSIDDQEFSNVCTISSNHSGSTVPNNNYVILYAEYKPDSGPALQAFLPIAMKTEECERMVGADRIIYNHLGTPTYSNISYAAHMSNGTAITNWKLNSPKDGKNKFYISPNCPSLNTSAGGGKALVAVPLYSKGENDGPIRDKVCVYCDYWSQPILIMQSNYDFAMLNEWDGSLTIDEENDIILATMLGAGKKDSENKFSGVLIGDIKGGTGLNSTEKMTGVYGFHGGVMSYALRENGTAFFGADGHGRIEIDGTSGIIRSTGWEKNNNNWILPSSKSGTLIDLNDGTFIVQGKNGDYIKFNDNEDGALEMSLSKLQIQVDNDGYEDIDTFVSSKIDISADELKTEVFSNRPSYIVHCGTPKSFENKILRFSKNDFEALCVLDKTDRTKGTWNLPVGTVIEVYCDGIYNTDREIKVQLGYNPPGEKDQDGNPLIIGKSDPIVVSNPSTSSTNLLEYGGYDTFSIRYKEGNKFEVVTPSYSAIKQTATEISSKVEGELRKTATYFATVETLAKPMPLLLKNAPGTADEFYQEGMSLDVTIGPKYANTAGWPLQFTALGRTIDIWFSGAVTSAENPFTWTAGSTIHFIYRAPNETHKTGRWVISDAGSYKGYSEVKQTADGVKTTVSNAGIKSDGSIQRNSNTFTMNITANGFYLNNANIADASNFVFKCNGSGVEINGGGKFSGNLTAATTNFTKLQAGDLTINGIKYPSTYSGAEMKIAVGISDQDNNIGTGGYLIVGSPISYTTKTWDDVSIFCEVIRETHEQTGYGNIGLPEHYWSLLYVNEIYQNAVNAFSTRRIKRDVQMYDNEQAYQELKSMPLYTFKYANTQEPGLSLGTMIDYMPNELMTSNTKNDDGETYNIGNTLFWNIAASQAIQKRVEELQQEVIELKMRLEENSNGIN